MSKAGDPEGFSPGAWSVIGRHDWDGRDPLELTLKEALGDLDGGFGERPLYEYVDTEAVVDVMAPGADRGTSEIRFEYRTHEVRIDGDGTIALR